MKNFNKTNSNSQLSSTEEKAISTMQLLGDKTRFKIFKLLMSKREMCVTEISEEIGISVSATSQHFRSFEKLGIVSKNRYGQKICYTINEQDDTIKDLANFAEL